MKKLLLSFCATLALATTVGASGCATSASSQKEKSPEQVIAERNGASVPKADRSKAPDGSRICVKPDGTEVPCSTVGTIYTPPVIDIR